MATQSPRRLAAICPERLYPLRAFQEASGIGSTRMREGRLAGIHLPTIDVGRRKFVRGSDGIPYIEALATLSATR
ncbi:hypothetical protein [Lacipirellula sp.]|uniref:hypothetical protein n=1 Tax=Lacipirellula sp. TaxID=2691419 RepID=UPI003D09F80C